MEVSHRVPLCGGPRYCVVVNIASNDMAKQKSAYRHRYGDEILCEGGEGRGACHAATQVIC